mgnify:CR=1 FL=1
MYLSGDVPLILQGAGTRENLSTEQAARVTALNTTMYTTPAQLPALASINPMLLYGALGLAAAGLLLSGRARGGRVW